MENIHDGALFRKLKTLIAVRALFVTILLGAFYVFQIGFSIFPYPNAVVYLVVLLYVLTIVYSVMLGKVPGRLFAYVQFCLDAIAVIMLIFLTGGIGSWFSPLMLLTVIEAPIVLDRKAGYFTAVLNSILYGLLIDLQFYGLLPISYDPMLLEKDFLYNIFSHISGIYLTAFLLGYLSSRLEKTSRSLEKKDTDLKDLTLFNEEVIENVPSGLFTTDMEGTVAVFNRAAENIMHIKKEDAIGRNISSLFSFIGGISERAYSEEVMESEDFSKVIGITISKMKDAKGEDTGFIGVFQDLSHVKLMEQEMKNKEKWAVIGELSANLAHEIRNPLASLKGAIEIIREDAVPKTHKENLMGIAVSEMDRLNTIIVDFLAYSRPKQLKAQWFDLNSLLDETVELLKTREVGNIFIVKDFHGSISINADPDRLRQVFWNLGINALEAMPEGGELMVSAKELPEKVLVTFRDTGGGITAQEMEKVFYPFYTTKPNGTGLGLSIAYRIIEDHEGRLKVRSRPGRGTTFEILLPKDTNGNRKG